jgi:hypothetical protein
MITAEAYIRKSNNNLSEDFIRGVVWAVNKAVGDFVKNRQPTFKEDIEVILKYESSFPELIAAEKDTFEFNRGASWGLQRYVLAPAKDETMDYPDRLSVIGGFQVDYIQSEEDALRMYESFPEEYYEQDSIDYLKKEIAWAKEIEANKTWK